MIKRASHLLNPEKKTSKMVPHESVELLDLWQGKKVQAVNTPVRGKA